MAKRSNVLPFVILGIAVVVALWNEAFYAYRSFQLEKPADTISGTLQAAAPAADPLFGPVPTAAVLRRTEESRTGMRYSRGSSSPEKVSTWGEARQTVSHAKALALGATPVDAASLDHIARFEPVPVTEELAGQIANAAPGHRVIREKDAFIVESTKPQDPDSEFIPAFRLRFEQIPLAPYTLAGQVRNGVLYPVAATAGSSGDAVADARRTAGASLWAMRLFAAAGVFFGLRMLSKSRAR